MKWIFFLIPLILLSGCTTGYNINDTPQESPAPEPLVNSCTPQNLSSCSPYCAPKCAEYCGRTQQSSGLLTNIACEDTCVCICQCTNGVRAAVK